MVKVFSPIGGDVEGVSVFTLTATRDPTTTDDGSTGVMVGHIWFNATAGYLRWWECRDNTKSAAKWVFSGADYANGGTNPATEVTMAGSSSALIAAEGNINRQISSAGISPVGTANDNVLAFYSLPANFFDVAGRGVCITAQGSTVSNTNTKTMKIIFNATTAVVGSAVTGGTTIASAAIATTAGSGGWQLQANVFKYGAAASNTQIGLHQAAQTGNAVAALVAPQLLTATENGAILIVVTGNAATTNTDIVFNFLEINAMN